MPTLILAEAELELITENIVMHPQVQSAPAAKGKQLPCSVASPCTPSDAGTATGADVPIEERSPEEVTHVTGEGGSIRVTASDAANPAFDVTPARLVTGYLTERGLLDRV